MPRDVAHRSQRALVGGRLPSSSLARSTWIPMTSTMCRRRIAKCTSLIGFMACPALMLVLVRSTRSRDVLTQETECSPSRTADSGPYLHERGFDSSRGRG